MLPKNWLDENQELVDELSARPRGSILFGLARRLSESRAQTKAAKKEKKRLSGAALELARIARLHVALCWCFGILTSLAFALAVQIPAAWLIFSGEGSGIVAPYLPGSSGTSIEQDLLSISAHPEDHPRMAGIQWAAVRAKRQFDHPDQFAAIAAKCEREGWCSPIRFDRKAAPFNGWLPSLSWLMGREAVLIGPIRSAGRQMPALDTAIHSLLLLLTVAMGVAGLGSFAFGWDAFVKAKKWPRAMESQFRVEIALLAWTPFAAELAKEGTPGFERRELLKETRRAARENRARWRRNPEWSALLKEGRRAALKKTGEEGPPTRRFPRRI